MENKYAVSLFSGSGIGDIGFKKAGFNFIAMSEIEYDRAELLKINFPHAKVFVGDINDHQDSIIQHSSDFCKKNNTEIFLMSCTAPCQGMSKSGQGTLLRNIRLGKRPQLDPRNRLILPALQIIKALHPRFVVFENVCEMRNTVIQDEKGNLKLILDIIEDTLSKEYVGRAFDVEFADYGVPQRRKRLITVYSRDANAIELFNQGIPFIPESSYSREGKNGKKKWISVGQALRKFPSLDSIDAQRASHPDIPFHRVPVLDQKKYFWIKHTPHGKSAFDNQCINPMCGFKGNQVHGTKKNRLGVNQSKKDTPLYCEKCGELLPRPYTKHKNGSLRIMSGYTSAYKRMEADLPSSAITRNLSFPCSDNKVHPFENRVLSLAEAMKLQTLSDYDYKWGSIRDKKNAVKGVASDTLIRLVIGESIPPLFTEQLGLYLINMNLRQPEFFVSLTQMSLL